MRHLQKAAYTTSRELSTQLIDSGSKVSFSDWFYLSLSFGAKIISFQHSPWCVSATIPSRKALCSSLCGELLLNSVEMAVMILNILVFNTGTSSYLGDDCVAHIHTRGSWSRT